MPVPKQLSAWMSVVAQVKKENPSMSYKDVLKMAKTIYRK